MWGNITRMQTYQILLFYSLCHFLGVFKRFVKTWFRQICSCQVEVTKRRDAELGIQILKLAWNSKKFSSVNKKSDSRSPLEKQQNVWGSETKNIWVDGSEFPGEYQLRCIGSLWYSSWWFQPLWTKMLVRLDLFPR